MWGSIKEGLARFVLVLSLDTDKIRCRWGRSSSEMVLLAARMLSRDESRGVNRDFAGP